MVLYGVFIKRILSVSIAGMTEEEQVEEAEEAEEDRMRNETNDAGAAPSKDVVVGSEAVDQFAPWYFGVAFAYLFKYCTAMPDVPTWYFSQIGFG